MATSFKKRPEINIAQPNILYFKIHFKRAYEKEVLGLTRIKYLFKLGLN